MSDTVRTKAIRSPSMPVIRRHLHNEDIELAELLRFYANMNARQLTLDTMLEQVPVQ